MTLFTGRNMLLSSLIMVRGATDAGSSELRAGFATCEGDEAPIACDNIVSRFKDRKRGTNVVLCGSDCYVDSQSRAAMKSAFDGDIVCGFDSMVRALTHE